MTRVAYSTAEEVDAFIAGRASARGITLTRPLRAGAASPRAAARAAVTPEQSRVDAFEYPATWTDNGQEAIAAARAAAPGGAGVDYPASWKV